MAVNKNGLFRYKLFGMVIESYFLFAHPHQTFTTLMQGQENGEGEKKTRCEMVGRILREVNSHDYDSSP